MIKRLQDMFQLNIKKLKIQNIRLIFTVALLTLVILGGFTNSYAQEILNTDDLKAIQNDSIITKRILLQTKEAYGNSSGDRNYIESFGSSTLGRENVTNPIIMSRNLSGLFLMIFILIKIVLVITGKASLQDLSLGVITAIFMVFGMMVSVTLLLSFTDLFAQYFNSIGKDFMDESLANMLNFNNSNGQDSIPDPGKFVQADYSKTTFTQDGFCFTTIQDQYRLFSMMFHWVYLILVYSNWAILIAADFIIKFCLVLSPIVGAFYVFGSRTQLINRYWSILLQAAVTKLIFFAVYGLIVGLTIINKPALTKTGVNIEYAVFCCIMLIVLFVATIKLSTFVKIDAGMKIVTEKIKQITK